MPTNHRGDGIDDGADEFQRLQVKHAGGIFVTKYPYRSSMFASPSRTRLEVDVGDDGPRLSWGGKKRKEMPLDEIKNVTIGIHSDVFRRFENKLMRNSTTQPCQCVSIHGSNRTVDLVLSSAVDAQDLKAYIEEVKRNPSRL